VDDGTMLAVLSEAAEAVSKALASLEDWGPAGGRPGQYRLDLAADAAALRVLHGAGLTVLSEESGVTGPDGATAPPVTFGGPPGVGDEADAAGSRLVVLDPVDGSTNAHRGIPMYAASLCVLDRHGPRVALVVNLATGDRYEAARGAGARRNGLSLTPSECTRLGEAIVGISGFPERHLGWAQFRALGAASLELCAVAEGVLDAYLQVGGARLFGWDFLGGLLICRESGAVVGDLDGRDLIVRDNSMRRPVAAATPSLLDELLAAARRRD
jgi:myo-inositol-1(or 4)-monophosphatase